MVRQRQSPENVVADLESRGAQRFLQVRREQETKVWGKTDDWGWMGDWG